MSGALGIRDRLVACEAPAILHVRPALDPNSLPKFVDPLPIPTLARASGSRPSPENPALNIPYYRIEMRQFEGKLHRDLKPTKLWGYDSVFPGPTIETQSGKGLLVEWVNELPHHHFLPVDHHIYGADRDMPDVRTVVHLHGGRTPSASDGYPESWYVPGHSALYHYPCHQDAAMLWYHDHAMGINRLNIFAGLAGLFIIRDRGEDALNLPRDEYEIPLVICDRTFDEESQLNYPVSGIPGKPWVPEIFGNATLVNGKLFPYLDVSPCKYRFRVLNASNSRFYYLSLSSGYPFWQIGTDQGLLPAPIETKSLAIAPAERADLVIDFAGQEGKQIIMKDDTLIVMQFRVSRHRSQGAGTLPVALRPEARIPESQAVKSRVLTLDEYDDDAGVPILMLLNGASWKIPVTEEPVINTTETWRLINLTEDSHPIHLHLVRFQILDRRPFDVFTYLTSRKIRYTGPAMPPHPGEAGWKDTVRAAPGMETRIIIPFEGYTGRYVWHCHILEHENNQMMRPYHVVPAT